MDRIEVLYKYERSSRGGYDLGNLIKLGTQLLTARDNIVGKYNPNIDYEIDCKVDIRIFSDSLPIFFEVEMEERTEGVLEKVLERYFLLAGAPDYVRDGNLDRDLINQVLRHKEKRLDVRTETIIAHGEMTLLSGIRVINI